MPQVLDILHEIPPEIPDTSKEDFSKGVFDEMDIDENGEISKAEFLATFEGQDGKKYSNILVQKAQSIFLWLILAWKLESLEYLLVGKRQLK